jgi:hypothetical protein
MSGACSPHEEPTVCKKLLVGRPELKEPHGETVACREVYTVSEMKAADEDME